jgi:hypothetical protein
MRNDILINHHFDVQYNFLLYFFICIFKMHVRHRRDKNLRDKDYYIPYFDVKITYCEEYKYTWGPFGITYF